MNLFGVALNKMDGILLVDKEKGITSRDVVNKISKELNIKKVGHAGTLDPLATGLMVIGIGKGTKILDLLTSDKKEYIAFLYYELHPLSKMTLAHYYNYTMLNFVPFYRKLQIYRNYYCNQN